MKWDKVFAALGIGAKYVIQVDSAGVAVHGSGGSGSGGSVSASFTPTAVAYGAGDTMDVAKEFALVGPAAGGLVRIVSTELQVAHTAVISGETSYRLYLYNVTPPSALADNAAWDLPLGDRTAFVGYLDLGTPVDIGSTLYVQTSDQNKDIQVPSGGSLWGYLVTVGAFTATAAIRKVTLHSVPL